MTYSVGKKKFVRDLGSGDTNLVPVSSHAKDDTFCGAQTVSVFSVRCESGGQPGADDAQLTIKDPDGHVTRVGPFAGMPPNDLRMIGPWIDIGSTDGRMRGQEYLLNPGTKTLKALPKGTSLESGNAPEMAPDLTLLSAPGAHLQQWLVHIPST